MNSNIQIEYKYSKNLFKNGVVIESDLFNCRIYWAKIISSETQSLLTQFTKHTFYEMEYAIDGKIGMLIDNNTKIDISPSNFVIVPPDTYHQIIDGDDIGARFIMAFSIEPQNEKIKFILNELSNISVYKCSRELYTLLSFLSNLHYSDEYFDNKIKQNIAELFVIEILKNISKKVNLSGYDLNKNGKSALIANQIRSYIASRAGVGLTVEKIAQKFNYSARHLNRILINEFGKTAKELIAYEKLKKIEEYTASTSLALYEIAELCGFADADAMNKFFKRYNKINLSSYREISGSKNADNLH